MWLEEEGWEAGRKAMSVVKVAGNAHLRCPGLVMAVKPSAFSPVLRSN